jgi:hypothetical protein
MKILNIFDMNIVPINIHALRREIPFVSLFSYRHAFNDIIKRVLRSEFQYDMAINPRPGALNPLRAAVAALAVPGPGGNPPGLDMKHASLLHKTLNTPYLYMLFDHSGDGTARRREQFHDIIEIVYGHADLPLGRPKFLAEEVFEKVIGFDELYQMNEAINIRQRRHAKPYIVSQLTNALADPGAAVMNPGAAAVDREADLNRWINCFNHSTIRTLFYLINLQRVIRLKMRQDMYWSLGPVVNSIQSIAPDVTEIEADRKGYKPTRR